MTSYFAKFVAKKILGETVKNNFGTDDPYFEQVPATRLDGTPNGKFKKKRKALPPGLSEHDGKVLTKVKRRAYRLDMSLFNCCGIRFGWSSVIGIIPAIGDVIDALMALMVVHTCDQIEGGLPTAVRSRMLFNICLDFGIGLVPFIGDIADAIYRANTRNAAILEQYLREKGKKTLRQSGLPVPAIDPSLPEEFDRHHATEQPPAYTSQAPSVHPAMSTQPDNASRAHVTPATPAQARVREDRRSGLSKMFGFVGKSRDGDIEMGNPAGPVGHEAGSSRLQKQAVRQ